MTKSTSLSVQLLRVGRAAGKGTRGGLIRVIALFCAAAALTFAAGTLVSAAAVYDSIAERGEARNPRVAASYPGAKPLALWKPGFDTVGGLQYSVISIAPLVPDAPLPPGVSEWPAPGEAVLSPALARAGASEGIGERLGRDVGRIGASGLTNPAERLAYKRPLDPQIVEADMFTVTGYGAPGSFIGDQLFIAPYSLFALAAVGLLLCPACVLVVIAARAGGEARDRRAALMDALGASRPARMLVHLGEASVPVALGATAAAGSLAALLAAEVPLPWTGFTIPSRILGESAGSLALAAVAAAALVLSAVVMLHRNGSADRTATRPGSGGRKVSRRLPLLCPLALLFATRGPALIAPTNPMLFLAIYFIGALATFATLPSAIALVVAALGRLLSRLGRRRGGTGTLVAGSWLAAKPGVTARLVTGFVVAIGLIGQIQLNTSRLSEPMLAAQETAGRIGNSVLTVQAPSDRNLLRGFLKSVPPGTEAFALHTVEAPDGSTSSTLQAPCRKLQAVDLRCDATAPPITSGAADPRLAALANWYSPSQRIDLREGSVIGTRDKAPQPRLVLLSADRGDLDTAAIKQAAYRHLGMGPVVEAPGGGWLSGALLRSTRVDWVMLFGSFALIAIGLAIGLNSIAEFLRYSRQFAPLGVLTGRRGLFVSVAAWALLMPSALAVLIGGLVYVWLSGPYTDPLVGAQLSWSGLAYLLSAVVTLCVGIWICGAWSAVRGAARWRPAAD